MKGPDHEKSFLGRVPPGTLASSSERFTKSRLDSYTHGQINRLLGSVVIIFWASGYLITTSCVVRTFSHELLRVR
ncbi:MAG: hypothetical protein KTR25_09150 [Myxococcales bacterium]|nr:hypothetical protein [Myxococcales bacterium]